MPSFKVKLDVDRIGFDALGKIPTAAEGVRTGQVIHLDNETPIEIGTLRHGMESGADSVAMCFTLPDGRIVMAETSAALFLQAARMITAWQDRRHRTGD